MAFHDKCDLPIELCVCPNGMKLSQLAECTYCECSFLVIAPAGHPLMDVPCPECQRVKCLVQIEMEEEDDDEDF